MLRLILVRHAKSAWDEPGLADFERPLAPRGRRAAAWIGDTLTMTGWWTGRILCSPARRTRETLDLALSNAPANMRRPEIIFSEELYALRDSDYVALIAAQGSEADTLMLVGHNSAMAETAVALTGTGEAGGPQDLWAFPTGAIARVDLDVPHWGAVRPGAGRLVGFRRPPKA